MSDVCTWCGTAVSDGFLIYEPEGERRATFCRLEHVVPWAIRGAQWEPGAAPGDLGVSTCAWCGGLASVHVVRTRGEHRVHDGFCGVEHLLEWAKAGGRYAGSPIG